MYAQEECNAHICTLCAVYINCVHVYKLESFSDKIYYVNRPFHC